MDVTSLLSLKIKVKEIQWKHFLEVIFFNPGFVLDLSHFSFTVLKVKSF